MKIVLAAVLRAYDLRPVGAGHELRAAAQHHHPTRRRFGSRRPPSPDRGTECPSGMSAHAAAAHDAVPVRGSSCAWRRRRGGRFHRAQLNAISRRVFRLGWIVNARRRAGDLLLGRLPDPDLPRARRARRARAAERAARRRRGRRSAGSCSPSSSARDRGRALRLDRRAARADRRRAPADAAAGDACGRSGWRSPGRSAGSRSRLLSLAPRDRLRRDRRRHGLARRRDHLRARTTCSLERALRPVTALALAARLPETPIAPGIRGPAAVVLEPRHRRADPRRARRRRGRAHQVRCGHRGRRGRLLFLGLVAMRRRPAGHRDRGATRSPTPSPRSAGRSSGSRAATSRPRSRSTTAARSACCRPASTGWPEGLRERERDPRPLRPPGRAGRRPRRAGRGRPPRRRGARDRRRVRRPRRLDLDRAGDAADRGRAPAQPLLPRRGRGGRVGGRLGEQVRGRRRALRLRRAGGQRRSRRATRCAPRDARRAPRARASRGRLRDRGLRRARGGRQRRRRAPLRVHGDRRPGERGRAPLRARQAARRARVASEAALARAGATEAAGWEVTDRTVLRGRLEATGLAMPRDRTESRVAPE